MSCRKIKEGRNCLYKMGKGELETKGKRLAGNRMQEEETRSVTFELERQEMRVEGIRWRGRYSSCDPEGNLRPSRVAQGHENNTHTLKLCRMKIQTGCFSNRGKSLCTRRFSKFGQRNKGCSKSLLEQLPEEHDRLTRAVRLYYGRME